MIIARDKNMSSNDKCQSNAERRVINSNSSDTTDTDVKEESIIAEQGGKYLYSDYSPLEYNKNIIHMLNKYTNICASVFGIQNEIERFHQMLDDSKILQDDLINKINSFGDSVSHSLNGFDSRYKNSMQEEKSESSSRPTFLADINEFFISNLSNMKEEYSRRSQSFDSMLLKRINDSKRDMLLLFQDWLSKDYYELPDQLLANSKTIVEAFIDNSNISNGNLYMIRKTTRTTTTEAAGTLTKKEKSDNNIVPGSKIISYSFLINGSRIDFWNKVNRVSGVGVKDLLIPFGLRTPLTEKLKQTLRIVPGLSREPAEKEPGFINADDYYIVSASMDQDKLMVLLASNPSELNKHVFRITYALKELYDLYDDNSGGSNINSHITQEMRPRIDCTLKEDQEPVQDVLQIEEVANATDISKLILFGRALSDKLRVSLDPLLTSNTGAELVRISIDNQDALAIDEERRFIVSSYNSDAIVSFLRIIANCFRPNLIKAKEKSSMRDEIIIRYQRPDGTRQEYSARIRTLIEQLQGYKEGQGILQMLGIITSRDNISSAQTLTTTDQKQDRGSKEGSVQAI